MQYHDLKDPGEISLKKIDEAFHFSMMTVLNEHRNMKKYQYIVFVEFLEMLCRIAIVCVKE